MPERHPDSASPFSALSTEQKAELYKRAAELFSDNKRALFDRLAPMRTRHISVVLEDIYQSHNAAAVLRSCDCFGVQDVHVVEANNPFNPAGDVAVGSSKWVDYYRYNSIGEVYRHLHAKGYRIVATLPHENDTMIGDLDISQPTALVFGTELTGLTQEAIAGADAYVKIPQTALGHAGHPRRRKSGAKYHAEYVIQNIFVYLQPEGNNHINILISTI